MTDGVQRRRIQRGKSRQGCFECKARHRKCDMGIPQCGGCVSRSVACSGYRPRLRWSNKHERFTPATFPQREPGALRLGGMVQGNAGLRLAMNHSRRNSERSASAPNSFGALQDSICLERLSYGPFDVPTALIDYWFGHVCQMWSTFDSDVNYKRQIAIIHCTSSEVVFSALQTMSAACLAPTVPYLQGIFPSLEKCAGAAIVRRMLRVHSTMGASADEVTTDLLFGILALGTSLHWARPSGHDFILHSSARSLLTLWDTESAVANPLHIAFFKQALIHWELLLAVSNQKTDHASIDARRSRHRQRLELHSAVDNLSIYPTGVVQPCRGPAASRGTRPNSSCGISSEVVDLYRQVLTLCRKVRQWHKQCPRPTPGPFHEPLCDFAVAADLQRELVALDFDEIVRTDEVLGFSLDTGDKRTPLVHHIHAAEAYRLASLLQLHMIYPDLHSKATPCSAKRGNLQALPHFCEHIRGLAASIISTLAHISLDSGLRSTLLVLYISAATGLKCAARTAAIDVLEHRQEILRQLRLSERNLPLRPVRTAIDLVQAIWMAYDAGGNEACWFDVMKAGQYRTLFC